MIVREAMSAQASAPPVTAGADGAVRSSWTLVCVQAELWPATSTAANRTCVVPSAEIVTDGPAVAADQVVPPLVDVSYW